MIGANLHLTNIAEEQRNENKTRLRRGGDRSGENEVGDRLLFGI
jgi:hypothetical protein